MFRKLVFWALQVPGSKRESQETSKYFPGEQIQTICSATELSISALIICSEKGLISSFYTTFCLIFFIFNRYAYYWTW